MNRDINVCNRYYWGREIYYVHQINFTSNLAVKLKIARLSKSIDKLELWDGKELN